MNTMESRKRILLVDDEEEVLKVLSRRLQSWGYEVVTAASGEESLKIAERRELDLILLDILMPGMKGHDVCARLKADPKFQRIPVVFLTALAMPENIEAGINAGADDYIIKPFNPQEMRERIEDCLRRHQIQWDKN